MIAFSAFKEQREMATDTRGGMSFSDLPEENPTEFVDAVEEFLIVGGSPKAAA